MKQTTITLISLASFAFGFTLFSNDPAIEPQNHDVEKEVVLEENFQNKEFQTDIAFIEGKEEEEKILGLTEEETIKTFNDIKETKSSYIGMSHSEINFELLDKVESYLKNNENGLIAYGTFSFEHDLENLFENMKNAGINLQVHYIPVHLQPYYRKIFGFELGDFPISENFYKNQISLPIYPDLKNDDVSFVINNLIEIISS